MDVNLLPNPVARRGLALLDRILKPLHKPGDILSPPRKILLCNSAHLGDFLLMTSLIAPLKAHFPDVEIGLLVGSWNSEAARGMADHLHLCDHWKTNRSKPLIFRYLKTRRQALKEIRERGYDVAIDCPFHFPNFAPLLYQAKIPVRIGYTTAGFSPLLTHPVVWKECPQHAADYFLDLLMPLGVSSKRPQPFLPSHPPLFFHDYLVLHMGTGEERKEWPEEKWRELALKLHEEGYSLVFTGKGEREKARIARVRGDMTHTVDASSSSFAEFCACIQHAQGVICGETAAVHVAAAYDTPTIALYTAINPLVRWRSLSKKAHTLLKPLPCSPCYRGCKAMRCLREIEVDEVVATWHRWQQKPLPPQLCANREERGMLCRKDSKGVFSSITSR